MINHPDRRTDLDIARAIAAFLVVMHHLLKHFNRLHLDHFDAGLLDVLQGSLLYFHMPTFMLVAGCVLAMGWREIRTWGDYWRFERKKLDRLILPFISVSLLTLVVKAAGGGLEAGSTRAALASMIYAPRGGPAPHLWFLYVLMGFFLLWPLLRRLVPDRWFPLLWLGMLVFAVLDLPWPALDGGKRILGMNDLCWYLPIFTLGFLYEQRWREQLRPRPVLVFMALVLCIGCLTVDLRLPWPKDDFWWVTLHRAVWMIGRSCGGLLVLWLCSVIARSARRSRKLLVTAGLRSYDCYLLHVALLCGPLVSLISKLEPDVVMTYVWFVVALILTWVGSMLIGDLIRRWPPLGVVLLGTPPARPKR
jgi:peptidoglycan/LPS O-acetylase OafA/YrhL